MKNGSMVERRSFWSRFAGQAYLWLILVVL